MATLTTLTASIPLCKRFELVDGVLVKHAYPKAKHFTSNEVEYKSLLDLFNAIKKLALDPKKPCVLTGELTAPLVNESRAHMCDKATPVTMVCLDFDGAPFVTPAAAQSSSTEVAEKPCARIIRRAVSRILARACPAFLGGMTLLLFCTYQPVGMYVNSIFRSRSGCFRR